MGSLEVAFSLDVAELVSPIDAELLYSEKIILDKRRFQCSGEGCKARVTCANLGRPPDKRKVDPHFRVIGEHSPSCSIQKASKSTNRARTSISTPRGSRKNKNPSSPDLFRPAQGLQDIMPTVPSEAINSNQPEQPPAEGDGAREGVAVATGRSSYGVISSPVSRFIQHSQSEQAQDFMIEDRTGVVHRYSDFFVRAEDRDLKTLPDGRRIYWGNAWVNYSSDDGYYRIVFACNFSDGELRARPTIRIYDSKLEEFSNRVRLVKELEARRWVADNNRRRCALFVYWDPRASVERQSNSLRLYLNIENLNEIDIRNRDILLDL